MGYSPSTPSVFSGIFSSPAISDSSDCCPASPTRSGCVSTVSLSCCALITSPSDCAFTAPLSVCAFSALPSDCVSGAVLASVSVFADSLWAAPVSTCSFISSDACSFSNASAFSESCPFAETPAASAAPFNFAITASTDSSEYSSGALIPRSSTLEEKL